jgi:hypothetical protein
MGAKFNWFVVYWYLLVSRLKVVHASSVMVTVMRRTASSG